jgi:hypothetical protein
MRSGRRELSRKQLNKISAKYKKIRPDEGFASPNKAEFRKATKLNPEDRADTMIEICQLRAFLKLLGGHPAAEVLQDKDIVRILAEVEERFTKHFTETRETKGGEKIKNDTADFLAAIIKRILEHQSNSIAGQSGGKMMESDEMMSLMFDEEDNEGNLTYNPSGKLKFMMVRAIEVIRVMRFVKYQKKLFRLKDEINKESK